MRRFAPFLVVLTLYCSALGRDAFDNWISATVLPSVLPETSVEVRDRNNQLLRAYTVEDGRWRLVVNTEQVDRRYLEMLIAYEDKRFFSHSGVDPFAVLRAAKQALTTGEIVSGASTLTMQVARLLEQSGTGAWRGKLRQMRVALRLEQVLSKGEILNLYLMLAPFGGNIEGIRAATLSYFGKEPRRLTAAEAALLVALPQAPEARRPDNNKSEAKKARQIVLDRLIATSLVSSEEARTAHLEPALTARKPFPKLAPHLSDRARRGAPEALVHRLTIEAGLQKRAEVLARASVQNKAERLSIAMVLADHQTGEVIAHVGSGGYSDTQGRQGFIDMTRALRSPGSTLKPLVYGLAFDQGLAHPASLINDRPVAFGNYAPQNFDGAFRGELRVDDALRQSLNLPVVLLLEELGPARLMSALGKAGLEAKVPGGKPGLAIALGGVGTTLEGLVQLYAGLAQGGKKRSLNWGFDTDHKTQERFLSPAAAWQVSHILAGLPPPERAAQMRLAYKTGTSYGHRDAWAIGFDGRYVAGVWIGRPDGTPVPGAFGGDLAAPILFELVGLVSDQAIPLPPPPPETLLLETSELPQPLRRFKGRRAVFQAAPDAPKLAFPPNGARLAKSEEGLIVKVRDGRPPFTWLANGAPILRMVHSREAQLPLTEEGYVQLSVIDRDGRSARANVRLD
ncbi:penicillin-binding protein 1C [Planktotalea sp.]|uniref:penicillin-binding protein 1C n=1 Tax=Planktotalea sp. TaxID=2029877 RepID=UPI003D6B2795